MVGTANCGNGIPLWLQRRAAPSHIAQPLRTALPWRLSSSLNVEHVPGYQTCGDNATKWAQHADDPNYNLLNECCQAINAVRGKGANPNPIAIGVTELSQRTMDYVLAPGAGRNAFVRYWRLLAAAAARHPSAVACELMNEPITWRRRELYHTWRAAAEAIHEVIPDMAVSVADPVEGAPIPAWLTRLAGAGAGSIDHETTKWIRTSEYLFYTWHYYRPVPLVERDVAHAIRNVQAIGADWQVPSFITELAACPVWRAVGEANISRTYWHYSSYCTTGSAFGNRTVPTDTFGACILGWAGGCNYDPCDPPPVPRAQESASGDR